MKLFDAIAYGTYRVLKALDRPARSPLKGRRPSGIALIIALVTITVLSAAVVEYAYSTRVNLTMSVNAKDKVKSYFLARSGVNLSRLLLNFQYALQNEADAAEGKQNLTGGSCNPGMISIAMRRSNFQIYQYMDLLMRPFNSGKLETPVGGINLSDAGVQGFGKFTGNFDVDIAPESGKLNINRFAAKKIKQEDLKDLCAMVADSKYTEIFRQDDENDQVLDQYRILKYVIDFIDLDETELGLTNYCTLEEGGSGSEKAQYDDRDLNIEPRNAKLTHIEELHQVYGIDEAFMKAFSDKLTVYPVGKPNANTAEMPVFYSILCRNVRLGDNSSVSNSARGLTPCQKSPQIALQVMYYAMALDGVRDFFKDPLSVLMAYVGSTESRLLPSAKKGQPVAFLRSSQVHSYLEDFKRNPQLMARFLQYSPAYRMIVSRFRKFAVDPRNPSFPKWTISFDRTGVIRAVSTRTPSIYRIKATGTYGSTKTTVETVVDFGKTVRKMPGVDDVKQSQGDSEEVKKIKKAIRKRRKKMPKGRILFWRENVVQPVGEDSNTGSTPFESEPGFGESDNPAVGSQQDESGFGNDNSAFGDDNSTFGNDGPAGFGDDQSGEGGWNFGN